MAMLAQTKDTLLWQLFWGGIYITAIDSHRKWSGEAWCRLLLSSICKGCGWMHFLSLMTDAWNLEPESPKWYPTEVFYILLITCYVISLAVQPSKNITKIRYKAPIPLLSNANRPVQTFPKLLRAAQEISMSHASIWFMPCRNLSITAQADSGSAGINPHSTLPSVVFAP